jgi:hypothetical protein
MVRCRFQVDAQGLTILRRRLKGSAETGSGRDRRLLIDQKRFTGR